MNLVVKADKVKVKSRNEDGTIKVEVVPLPFEGSVKLKILTYKEQIQLGKQLKYEVAADGSIKERSDLDMAIEILNEVEKAVTEVKIKRLDTGFEIESFEMLSRDVDGKKLIDHLGGVLTDGVKLGEK